MSAFLTSFKSTLCGVLEILCASAVFAGLFPPMYIPYLMLTCGVLNGLGLIAAKDADRTGHHSLKVGQASPNPLDFRA